MTGIGRHYGKKGQSQNTKNETQNRTGQTAGAGRAQKRSGQESQVIRTLVQVGQEAQIEAEIVVAENPVGHLLLAHPHPLYGGNMHNKIVDQVFRRGSEAGFTVARFNFRGVGASSGHYHQGQGEVRDAQAVLAKLLELSGAKISQCQVLGYSFGAWVLWNMAQAMPQNLCQVLLIAPPVGLYPFSKQNSPVPVRVFGADQDELVRSQDLAKWFHGLSGDKQLTWIAGAKHFFSGKTLALLRQVFSVLRP